MPDSISWWRTGYTDSETDGIVAAIKDERLSQGKITDEFEARFADSIGSRFAVATTSGSVALYLALKGAGIGPGDEVIVPNRTWVATAHAVLLAGASVRLVDVQGDRPVIDAGLVEAAITPRTKALLPVHLGGRACDIDRLAAIAAANGLALIEDACQAMFSRKDGKCLGTFGIAGCFSLGVTKLITTAQGGMLVTDDEALWRKIRLLRNHGVVDNFTEEWAGFGYNFKFTDLQAAAGLAQLAKAPERCGHVRRIHAEYAAGLAGLNSLRLIPVDVEAGELPLYVEVLVEDRAGLIEFLKGEAVQVRPLPPSLHTSKYFGSDGDYARSLAYAGQGLYLPCGPTQSLDNVRRVIALVRRFLETRGG